jgi:hypothetical protein
MQTLMAYVGQLDSYEKSAEIMKEMLRIDVSETQIYRVTDEYGAVRLFGICNPEAVSADLQSANNVHYKCTDTGSTVQM